MIQTFRRIYDINALTADDWNRLVFEVERLSQIQGTGGSGVNVSDDGTGYFIDLVSTGDVLANATTAGDVDVVATQQILGNFSKVIQGTLLLVPSSTGGLGFSQAFALGGSASGYPIDSQFGIQGPTSGAWIDISVNSSFKATFNLTGTGLSGGFDFQVLGASGATGSSTYVKTVDFVGQAVTTGTVTVSHGIVTSIT